MYYAWMILLECLQMACNVTNTHNLLAFLHYIYNLWFPKQIRYFARFNFHPSVLTSIFRHHWVRKQCISVWAIMLKCWINDVQSHQNPWFVNFSTVHIWGVISEKNLLFHHQLHTNVQRTSNSDSFMYNLLCSPQRWM